MRSSQVFFSDLRASFKEDLLSKLIRLADQAGLGTIIKPRSLVAIKLHFGEKGGTAFIRPLFVRRMVDRVREMGGFPFLTDANTLYGGTRGQSVSHMTTAVENGFAYSVVNAPLIIADGLRGSTSSGVKMNQEMIKTAYLAKEIVEADILIGMAHFKGHEFAGFGGAIKNIGMGCASRRGKLDLHSDLSPKVKQKKCVGCGECIQHCPSNAISLHGKKALVHPGTCLGCGECISVCPNDAMQVQWNADVPRFQKKMAEYTLAVLEGKKEKALFFNFLTQISPDCDCFGHTDTPIVRDIGILASKDPVAIDQASVDLINQQKGLEGSRLSEGVEPGEDKFRGLYPKVDWRIQLKHGEKIGLGNRKYELIHI